MKFPVTLYHPANDDPAERERFIQQMLARLANKTITARTQEELDGLTKIGWKVKE